MKNASKHAATLKSLQKRLLKAHKPPEPRPQVEPLRALVLGVLREGCADARADAAMSRFDAEFVDVNELRVATELELADLMGAGYPDVAERSVRLRELLMNLFDREGRLSVDKIAALNKKEQRQRIRGVALMTPFIEGHLCLLGLGQSALPVDESMQRFLIGEAALDADADLEEVQRFLEGQLKADDYWPFYFACRAAALSVKPAAPKRPRAAGTKSARPRSARSAKIPKKATSKRPA